VRVLVAFDKFKDSLTAPQACGVAARALRQRHPEWTLDLCPLADGGEGFAALLTAAAGGELMRREVTGPRGERREAAFGVVAADRIPAAARSLLAVAELSPAAGRRVAVIEMAAASGLALVPPAERDPWLATSRGTGELIAAAADRGVAAILLGVGGSATHDLGMGALAALGLEFYRATGASCDPPVPARWAELVRIGGTLRPLPPIRIACDVTNPLLGPRGAAAVYAPQKGLRAANFERLERGTAEMADRLARYCGQSADLAAVPGAGAAGGIAFGLMTAADATLLPGFDLIAAWLDVAARMKAADLILTGEGRFDASSRDGKGPGALAGRARTMGKPVHIFAGEITTEAPGLQLHAITPAGMPLPEALRAAEGHLAAAVAAAF
jgi:glycerate kinase